MSGQFSQPPPLPGARPGGGGFKFDPKAIEKAEAALAGLSSQFDDWMESELTKLNECHRNWKTTDGEGEAGEAMYRCFHDLKGLGTTYEYPVVSVIASLACQITETDELRGMVPTALIDAHVAAIIAAVKQQIKTADHPAASALIAELKSQIGNFVKDAA